MDHVSLDRLQEIARAGLRASPLNDTEWEHFRHCDICIARFGELVRDVVRAKDHPVADD